jgi:hypothetical protein
VRLGRNSLAFTRSPMRLLIFLLVALPSSVRGLAPPVVLHLAHHFVLDPATCASGRHGRGAAALAAADDLHSGSAGTFAATKGTPALSAVAVSREPRGPGTVTSPLGCFARARTPRPPTSWCSRQLALATQKGPAPIRPKGAGRSAQRRPASCAEAHSRLLRLKRRRPPTRGGNRTPRRRRRRRWPTFSLAPISPNILDGLTTPARLPAQRLPDPCQLPSPFRQERLCAQLPGRVAHLSCLLMTQ